MLKKLLKICIQDHKLAILLITLGSIILSLAMVKSGWRYDYGLGFWGANGHDGVWHMALSESINRPGDTIPIFAGESVHNYHLGFDYILAILNKITFIPINNLYFQIFPILLSLSLGTLAYMFVLNWQKSKLKALGAVFFVYFGGSLGWIVNLLRNGNLDGESMFWAQQSVSTLINPPYAMSLILILVGLIFLQKGTRQRAIGNRNKRYLLIAAVIFGLVAWVKIYGGILILGSLFIAGVYRQLKRKGTGVLRVFLGATILSAILVLPVLSLDRPSLEFKPFWFLETMMAISDRLGWEKYYSAMINYRLAGNYLKLIIAYFAAFGIFLVGNFGTRIVGIFQLIKQKKFGFVDVIFLSLIAGGIFIPMFFVQSGTPWNTIQFMYYSLFFMGIYAGLFLGDLFANRKITSIIFGILIMLITIPTTLATLYFHYLPSRPPAMLPSGELEALEFLREQPEGIVLTYPYDAELAQAAMSSPPRPLYLYESTAYVSAYSDKDVYLEDEVNLNITGYDWPKRRESIENWYRTIDHDFAYMFLRQNNIDYIYWVNGQRATLGETQLGIEEIYKNDFATIYKVN